MKTRFAPSPTGPFHIGGLRTALLVSVLAEKEHGQSILRLEDTDTQRSTSEYENDILESLSWAGLEFPQPYPKQSQRLDRYSQVINQLLDRGLAYKCYMSVEELDALRSDIRAKNKADPTLKLAEKYDNRYRPENWPHGIPQELTQGRQPVIRLKMPTSGLTQWQDLGKGLIKVSNQQLDDLIIARADGSPTYNFVVVVDDLDMGVTHVIRGDDHISNTPKQIQIAHILQQLPGFSKEKINYCHVPLMFNPDGSKISKSALANPDNQQKVAKGYIVPASLSDYRKMGILPEALTNYLLLISSQKTAERTGSEIFDRQVFVSHFSFDDLSKTGAKFDLAKLREINFQYISKMDLNEFEQRVVTYAKEQHDPLFDLKTIQFSSIASEVQKRSKTLQDAYKICVDTFGVKKSLETTINPFYKQLMTIDDHDCFKQAMIDHATSQNKKMGDIAKSLRAELAIGSGLPLFELFQAVKNHDLKKKLSP